MDEATLLTIVLSAVSITVTILIWVASTHAARIAEDNRSPDALLRKTEADAYERARSVYEGAIDQLEREVQRLQQQLTEATQKAAADARAFEAKMTRLSLEIARLQGRIKDDTRPQSAES